ncbi:MULTISPECIES: glycoside hydrolase family 3 N-terminal domain-containing protein [unclassified Microbacterium]|uniref:glycoside hydrolase family 3 N-terminal domain-containing protein n=1 Tax=unclassified Microbacterium TaxID=2609290 RepID=UPI001FCE598A|nr:MULTISPECIES: glycoside hydrolase family 3 N-terminal domain-containing protein [unclassified Microbacterium]
MTDDLERLANGVLWPGFLGAEAPQWLRDELRDGLAGVVYFGQNVGDGLPALSAEILAANPDALIGIDEEGGSVTRLESATGSTVPGAAQLGLLDDLAATERTGAELARRVRAVGANVVLGPVADVNTDPRNPVIGVRAFGDDEALVSRHVIATIDGIQDAGVAACVKHFPGHGDTHMDSHHALPEITLDLEEFERVHLEPFRAAVDAGVDAVMTAHIVVPAWGPQPATLNPRVLGMLRDWGFDGVIITDALDMAAIRETVGLGGERPQPWPPVPTSCASATRPIRATPRRPIRTSAISTPRETGSLPLCVTARCRGHVWKRQPPGSQPWPPSSAQPQSTASTPPTTSTPPRSCAER